MTVDLAPAVRRMEAELAGARLIAELAHGIDNRDVDRVMVAWHPACVLTIAPGKVLEGRDAVRDWFETTMAACPEMYHWFTNVSLDVTSETTMHGECRVSALVRRRSGESVHEIGTEVYEFVRDTGDWLVSSLALTIQRKHPVGPRGNAE